MASGFKIEGVNPPALDNIEPDVEQISLPTVLAALADPNRLALLRVVAAQGPIGCSQAAEAAGLTLTKSTRSHHYRTLREAGVFTAWYAGTSKILAVRTEDLESRFPGLLSAVLSAH